MPLTDQQFQLLVTVGLPLLMQVIERLKARGTEPTLEAVRAEIARDEERIRFEAHGFYARHPELHPPAAGRGVPDPLDP